MTEYVELHCHSAFSLLDGASHPEVLVKRALELGHRALALTDHDDLGGAVSFAQAAHNNGLAGLIGCELTVAVEHPTRGRPSSGSPRADRNEPSARLTHLTVLAESREGYANLSTLVTRSRMDQPRGSPHVSLDMLARHARGLFALTGCPRGWVPSLLAAGDAAGARDAASTLLDIFQGRLAIECWDHHLPEERAMVRQLIQLADALGVPWVVTNDVHYAAPRARIVHDVLCCLRHGKPLDAMGTRLRPNGEWYLKSAKQMLRRWRERPEGIRATVVIAERCTFRMQELEPTLPVFPLPYGVTADEYLAELVEMGATERWGAARTSAHDRQIAHELTLIAKLELAGYFLIVWDIVRFARREGILCQGRGSAANSAVCYCLAITAVDPIAMKLLFGRFLSEERQGAPDIDLDFAHQERERVIQYVYETYGREHAAMVCEQITYRGKSAVRDAARVLGFSVEQAGTLASLTDRFSARAIAGAMHEPGDEPGDGDAEESDTAAATRQRRWSDPHRSDDHAERRNPVTALRSTADRESLLSRAGFDPADKRVRALPAIVAGLHQIPRHRSIHVGGFVLTREPLSTIVPIEPASMPGRTVVQWDKDDVEAMGLVKIDLLGLGMLTLLQECVKHIRAMRGHTIDLATLDYADPAVYDDLCKADTIGVFQVESRAQMQTLPRLKPRELYDLVIEVALIRPGPIQGEMVHPYLRRRAGEETIEYPHESMRPILERTCGVPLFQEQGMQVAITAAGFTPGEADNLRRAMGHKRSREKMAAICERMIAGMIRNGIPEDMAWRIFNQINGFADYGFPESHAASFALLVYASAYLKHYYAPEFTAAILNAQPMGFYAPGTLIEDARRHGVVVLPVDLTRSGFDTTLEVAEEVAGATRATGVAAGVTRETARGAPPEHQHTTHSPSLHHHSTAPAPIPAPAVRLGLRLVRGLGKKARDKLAAALASGGPFQSISDVVTRSRLDQRSLRLLAEAGAFDAMMPDEPNARRRRAAIWRLLEEFRGGAGPLAPLRPRLDVPAQVPAMSPLEITAADYRVTGVSLNGHPMRHLRSVLVPNGVKTAREIAALHDGTKNVAVAGLIICRQRPGTAKGFVFLTLEDETGMVNVVITPKRFERQALMISRTPLLLVRGTLQVEERVVNLRGEWFGALDAEVGQEGMRWHDFH